MPGKNPVASVDRDSEDEDSDSCTEDAPGGARQGSLARQGTAPDKHGRLVRRPERSQPYPDAGRRPSTPPR
eukprot:1128100-Lingulodinium_polyedra.AAC.1